MAATDDSRRCGVGIRGVAMAIDSFAWFLLFFAATIPVAAATGQIESTASGLDADLTGFPAQVAFALWLALGIGYHALLEWRFERTAGKYLVDIRVRNEDGTSLSLRTSVLRNVARLVDFLPACYVVGIVAVLASGENQRLGDRLADTVVVRT